MRDITRSTPPVRKTPEPQLPKSKPILSVQPTAKYRQVLTTIKKVLASSIDACNQAGGMLRARVDAGATLRVIAPAKQVVTRIVPNVKKDAFHEVVSRNSMLTLHKVKHSAKQAHAQTKEKLHTTNKHLKTPLGKVALIQAGLVLALFAYVHNVTSRIADQSQEQIPTPSAQAMTFRQFLPASGEAVVPKPFEVATASTETPLYAWVTPWNADQQQKTVERLSAVSAFWLTLADNSYDVTAKGDWAVWESFATSLQEAQPTYLTVSGDPEVVATMLSDSDLRQKHIETLFGEVVTRNFTGIDIDYEGLTIAERDLFTTFIRELSLRFDVAKKEVAVTVEARIGNQVPMDWSALASVADQVHIMAYDYHSRSTGFPGPIAPVGWIKDVLDYASTRIPSDKLVVGLGNYGYDWVEPTQPGLLWEGVGVSYNQAIQQAQESNTPVIRSTGIDERGFDIGGVPTYTYTDTQGRRHEVWFEDQSSLSLKQQLAAQYKPKGIIFWSVGLGDATLWKLINN